MNGYQVICNKAKKMFQKQEENYNPLSCKLDSIIKINHPDFKDLTFKIVDILEYSIPMNDQVHKITDYVLDFSWIPAQFVENKETVLGLSVEDIVANKMLRLRAVPDSFLSSGYRSAVIKLYDECEYSQDLHNVVKDDAKTFFIDDEENDTHEEFFRVNDIGLSYASKIKKAGSEVYKNVEFWDYFREADYREEFIFVEMDQDNGWFQIWRGFEIGEVTVF